MSDVISLCDVSWGGACSLRVAFRALSEDGSPAGWRGCNPCGVVYYLGSALPYIWTGNVNGLHTAARGALSERAGGSVRSDPQPGENC